MEDGERKEEGLPPEEGFRVNVVHSSEERCPA